MTFAFQFLIDFYQKISFLSKNLNKDVQIFQLFTLSPTQWKDLLSLIFLFTFFFLFLFLALLKKGSSKVIRQFAVQKIPAEALKVLSNIPHLSETLKTKNRMHILALPLMQLALGQALLLLLFQLVRSSQTF